MAFDSNARKVITNIYIRIKLEKISTIHFRKVSGNNKNPQDHHFSKINEL